MAQLMIFQDWTNKGTQKLQIWMSMLDPKHKNKNSFPAILGMEILHFER